MQKLTGITYYNLIIFILGGAFHQDFVTFKFSILHGTGHGESFTSLKILWFRAIKNDFL